MRYSVKMKRLIITMALTITMLVALGAQTTTPDTPSAVTAPPATTPETPPAVTPPPATTPEKPKTETEYEPIRKGDQFIHVSLAPSFALFNIGPNGINTDTRMNLGGTGALGYSRFINTKIALGGSIAFSFNPTRGGNLFFYLPITFTATYELVFNRIHVPLTVNAGVAFQTYNAMNYFGPILKPEVAAYYQFSPEWSFGVQAAWNCIPEIYAKSSYNRVGNILDIGAGFRYHF